MLANSAQVLANLTDPQIDAMVEIMLLAASADGSLDDSEIAELRKSLLEVDDLWLSHVDLDARIAAAKKRLIGQDRTEHLATIQATLPNLEQRVLALNLVVKIVAADGVLRTTEFDLLLEAANALGVDGATVADLVKSLGL